MQLMYHDGTEGLGQHFGRRGRFDRPIVSMPIFRLALSFGCKYFEWSMANSRPICLMARSQSWKNSESRWPKTLHSADRYDRKEWRVSPEQSNIDTAINLDLDISTRLLKRLDISKPDDASSAEDIVWAAYEHDREISFVCEKALSNIVAAVAGKKAQEPSSERVVQSVLKSIVKRIERNEKAKVTSEKRIRRSVASALKGIVKKIERKDKFIRMSVKRRGIHGFFH